MDDQLTCKFCKKPVDPEHPKVRSALNGGQVVYLCGRADCNRKKKAWQDKQRQFTEIQEGRAKPTLQKRSEKRARKYADRKAGIR